MKKYNYREALCEDIKGAMFCHISREEIAENRELAEEWLDDNLWTDDAVTGNGSGSYTFSRDLAAEYVGQNLDLLAEAVREFSVPAETVVEYLENPEAADVTIRCYLLAECVAAVLDEIETETANA